MSFYALQYDVSTGQIIGVHAYVEEPAEYPDGEIACTQAQAQNSMLWSVVNGALVESLDASKDAQTSALKQSYGAAISSCPVTINGKAYTLALDSANATLNLSAAMSAQQALSAPAWTADADVVAGQLCTISGVPIFCSKPGATGSTAPTVPTTIGTPVTDGTVSWELFARSAELANGSFAWFTAAQIVSVGQQIELFLHQQKSTLIGLLGEVAAQTAVPSTPVTWP